MIDVVEYMTSTSRPDCRGGIVFLILASPMRSSARPTVDALHRPAPAPPRFFSGQKQLFLTDPLFPSDLLFGRQIMELLPAMVAAEPMKAVGLAVGSLAFIVALITLIWKSRKVFPRLNSSSRCAPRGLLSAARRLHSLMDPMAFSAFVTG